MLSNLWKIQEIDNNIKSHYVQIPLCLYGCNSGYSSFPEFIEICSSFSSINSVSPLVIPMHLGCIPLHTCQVCSAEKIIIIRAVTLDGHKTLIWQLWYLNKWQKLVEPTIIWCQETIRTTFLTSHTQQADSCPAFIWLEWNHTIQWVLIWW